MFDFEYQLSILPRQPGVYIMKNSLGEIIYIGKAKILRNRVRSYFKSPDQLNVKTRHLVSNIAEFEFIVTDSEIESLILEQNLIKENMPKYNINLKDDKRFPFIKVTVNEDFPRVFMTRNLMKDKAKYFGPYTDVNSVYETLEAIKKVYPIRTCKRVILEDGPVSKPCLNYHLGLCSAPCSKMISKEDYKKIIDDVIDLLNGKKTEFVKNIKKEMEEAAGALDFEKAAKLRDKYLAIEKVQNKQKIYFTQKENDEDYVSIYSDGTDSCVQVFFQRDGKIQGREHFMINDTMDEDTSKVLEEFLESFYGKTAYIPKQIYTEKIENFDLLEEFLSLKKGQKVFVEEPTRGEKKRLLELVRKNAEMTLTQFKGKIIRDKEDSEIALNALTQILELEEYPHRIESYDISNIAGVDSVGSMIVFEDGRSKTSDYRRFRIKSVKGANDYESLREILRRRFERGLKEIDEIKNSTLDFSLGKFSFFPDLILMDGGKGQISAALEVLEEFGLDIPVAGIVKDDRHRTRGIIYNGEEKDLSSYRNVIHLLTKIQDEVHRFAITYHRSLRNRTTMTSVLDSIKGVGEKRRKNLLLHFGSIENIKNASVSELLEVNGMDKRSASQVFDFFHENKE